MPTHEIVIVAAKRTPIGAFLGQFSDVSATDLGATAIRAALESAGVKAEAVDEVIMGCVLPAGLGQAPARQAALAAGLPVSAPCTTINKVCGSGMKTVMQACDAIAAGSANIVVAGGMESMTNAPYLVQKARQGLRFGHAEFIDHMMYDGLQNASDKQPMGNFAERCVQRYDLNREQQDAYAIETVKRATAAVNDGHFKNEIAAITLNTRKGEVTIEQDETPGKCNIDKIPTLKPAFSKEGSVTAATSASISDGAAALILMSAAEAKKQGLQPLARIVGYVSHAREPEDFTLAPIDAIKKLYAKTGWSDGDVDLYEINEAFAAVTMAAMKELKLDHAKVNVNGGACALGHPIGATGSRIIVTLLHALQHHDLQRGIASLCIGGGEATAIAIELTNR